MCVQAMIQDVWLCRRAKEPWTLGIYNISKITLIYSLLTKVKISEETI